MAWRFVKQPNGRLARFVDMIDHFTVYDMTPMEAEELCVDGYGMTPVDAKEKVRAGLEDPDRWKKAFETIRSIHGIEEAFKWLLEMTSNMDRPEIRRKLTGKGK